MNNVITIFVYSKITKQVIDKLPKLKFIATMSTGVDHIDLEACKKRKIKVSNVPYYGENTVAEHTMALLLSIAKRIPESIEKAKTTFSPKGLRGFDLKGKTIGIIGMGRIGSHVARMAKGFEMNVVAFNRSKKPKLAKEIGFKYTALSSLLKYSDVISLHLPLTDSTHHIINEDAFKKMKPGVVILNTARGGLIDSKALVRALKKNIVASAGIDVLEEECHVKEERELLSTHVSKECDIETLIADHILIKREDVLVTPHNAFNTKEALLRILNTSIGNVKSFLKGRVTNRV
ncbi:MAG: NAD(P)-dependent oxidoreductase [Candidatus Nanoarchaeia archaeon]